jgi:hypothetical protein
MRLVAGAVLVALAVCVGTARAATITLRCSGSALAPGMFNKVVPVTGGLAIDVDLNRVRIAVPIYAAISLGEFSITKFSDSAVVFEAPFSEGSDITGKMLGVINRISGESGLMAYHNSDPSTPILWYELSCGRADALF